MSYFVTTDRRVFDALRLLFRYFRGYVTRRDYRYLLRSERHRREDQRQAAIQIQQAYRRHLVRTKRIYARAPVQDETLSWAREYKRTLVERERMRNARAGATALQ